MKVITERFGELEISEDLIITMTKPILGFEHLRKYVIVETDDFEPFKWFQSIDDPGAAFVIINPLHFFHDYMVEVNPKEIEELNVVKVEDVLTYAIVTIPQDYTKMTANLQGPVLINSVTRLAKQLVMVNSHYKIKHRMFETVKSAKTAVPKRKVLAEV
ncbi:MAG: flagellar assembly protein FliW [candidate division Zixibacteria bacterium]